MTTETQNHADTLDALGVTVEPVFVPFSQSRNKDAKHPSLNWRVTVKRNGHDVLTTDYSAGAAHCPGYSKKPRAGFFGSNSAYQQIVTRAECEKGKPVKRVLSNDDCLHGEEWIKPDPVNVLYALTMDCDVLDFGCFEDWATDLGYGADSRAAEAMYKACIGLALQMRAAFGDSGLSLLRETFQDY